MNLICVNFVLGAGSALGVFLNEIMCVVFVVENGDRISCFGHSVHPVLSLCIIGLFSYITLHESLLQPWYNP